MSPETVTTQFEELYRGVTASVADLPVDPPTAAPNAAWTRLEQDIRLDADDDRLRSLLDVCTELEALGGLRRLMDRYPDRRSTDALRARLGRLFDTAAETGRERSDPWAGVDTAPPLRVHWDRGETTTSDGRGRDLPDTAPLGARIQLSATHQPVRSPADFHRRLVDHLRCQLRDCYVGMGLAPPRDLRVRGPGIAWFTHRYESADHRQRYHDPDAVIDWTALPPVPTMDD